jgi:hypothetical protein
MTYLLAQLRLKEGADNASTFFKAFDEVEAMHEPITGWRLLYRLHAPNGDAREVWHLWDMGAEPDARARGRAAIQAHELLRETMMRGSACVESEVTRELEQRGL